MGSELRVKNSLEPSSENQKSQSFCHNSPIVKISLVVFGLLLIGGAIIAHIYQVNAIASYVMGSVGGVLILATVIGSIIHYLLQSNSDKRQSEDLKESENSNTNDFTARAAPWVGQSEPNPLPAGWVKHQAKQSITVPYGGKKGVTIPRGKTYFTYKGKIAIGFHGTYDPPWDMS